MELFRIIKKDAMASLRLCWGRVTASAMAAVLVYLAISLGESLLVLIFTGAENISATAFESSPAAIYITAGAALVYLFTMPALSIGQKKLCLSFVNGEDESLAAVFDCFCSFKKFFGAAVFALVYGAKLLLTFGVCALPGGVLIFIVEVYMPTSTAALELLKIAGFLVGFILLILCFALGIIFSQRWALAEYYRAEGEKVFRAFSLSVKATVGQRVNIISFKFSFIGWGLLCGLILPLLWAIPYYSMANAIYGKYLMEKYSKSLAEVPPEVDKNPLPF